MIRVNLLQMPLPQRVSLSIMLSWAGSSCSDSVTKLPPISPFPDLVLQSAGAPGLQVVRGHVSIRLSERVIARLSEQERTEREPWRRDDLRIAWMTVLKCSEIENYPVLAENAARVGKRVGEALWEYAFACYLGKSPDKLIPFFVARAQANKTPGFPVPLLYTKYWQEDFKRGMDQAARSPKKPVQSVRPFCHTKEGVMSSLGRRSWPNTARDREAFAQAKRELADGKIRRTELLARAQRIKEELEKAKGEQMKRIEREDALLCFYAEENFTALEKSLRETDGKRSAFWEALEIILAWTGLTVASLVIWYGILKAIGAL